MPYPWNIGDELTAANLNSMFFFGGDGSDGALAITTGTTTVDLSNARVVVLNYTSVSITGDGVLAFSNPHANGTFVIIRSLGDVTLTSTATPMIDASGIGGNGGAALGIGATSAGNNGTDATSIFTTNNKGLGAVIDGIGIGGAIATFKHSSIDNALIQLYSQAVPGSGGGSGNRRDEGTGTCDSGGGGRGGGALIIECRGAWNFTTANGISVKGDDGGSPTTEGAQTGGGGGGGGAGGYFLAIYNTLTSNAGTVTVDGGTGGSDLNTAGLSAVSGGAGGGSVVSAGIDGNKELDDGNGDGGDGGDGLSTVVENILI